MRGGASTTRGARRSVSRGDAWRPVDDRRGGQPSRRRPRRVDDVGPKVRS